MKRVLFLIFLTASAWAQSTPQLFPAAWTSATTVGSSAAVITIPTQGQPTANVALNQVGTINVGVVTFEVSDTPDATVTDNWYSVACLAPTTNGSTYGLSSNTKVDIGCNVVGSQRFRARLSGAIGGSGTANLSVQLAPTGNVPPGSTPPSGTLNQGTQGSQSWLSLPVLAPVTSGNTTTLVVYLPNPYTTNATPTGNASQNVKATSANVWGYDVQNPNASTCWLEFYNAISPSLGATRVWGVPILGSGGIAKILPYPINLSTALTIATTTADAGGTTCSTGMGVTLYYQ